MKRFISTLLSICLVLNCMSPVRLYAAGEGVYAPGDDTKTDTQTQRIRIEIKTAEDLCMLAQNCHEDTYSTDKEV